MSEKRQLVIFGTGKIADIVYSCIKDDPECNVEPVAFTVDAEYCQETKKFGLPVIEFERVEKIYPPQNYVMLVAMGYHRMNAVRAEKYAEAESKGYTLASYIHSSMNVPSTSKIGKNVLLLDGVDLGPFTEIDDGVCIFSGASIAHHVRVASNVWIASGTVIGGNTTVGENCFLGINTTIGHNIRIGSNNFCGANTTLTKCTEDNSVYITPDTPKYRLDTEHFLKLFHFD